MKNFYSISNIEFGNLKKKYSFYLTLALALLLGTISLSCVGSSEPIGLPSGVIVEDKSLYWYDGSRHQVSKHRYWRIGMDS